jgi:hypothetical protein
VVAYETCDFAKEAVEEERRRMVEVQSLETPEDVSVAMVFLEEEYRYRADDGDRRAKATARVNLPEPDSSPLHNPTDLILDGNTSPLHVNYKAPSSNIHTGFEFLEFLGATLEYDVDDCDLLAGKLTGKGGPWYKSCQTLLSSTVDFLLV